MVINTKLHFFLCFLSLFLLSTSLVLATDDRDPQREHQYRQCQEQCRRQKAGERRKCQRRCDGRYGYGVILLNTEERQDPQREYQQCQQQCRQEEPGQQQQQQQCQQRCEERYEQQRDPQREYQQCQQQCRQQPGQQQCQERCQEQYGRQQQPNPQRRYQQCQEQCRYQEGRQHEQCQQRCEEQYGEQQEDPQRECQQQCRRQQGQQQQQRRCEEHCEEQRGGLEEDENPYLFGQDRFREHMRSQEGNIRVLERFSRRSSKLLEGIDNYRVTLTVANPSTFMVPNHWDADSICIVLNGRGGITLIQEENKVSYKLEQGDIYRIRAGTTGYSVNSDKNEKLYVLELTLPVNTPGHFESFFAPGGRDQESFFSAFSDEILEAAFNTGRDELRKLFQGQKQQGPFIRASQQQIRALLSGHSTEQSQSQSSRRPYNLLNQRPTQSNTYGRLYQAYPDDYRELRDLDVALTFANITRGAMFGPYYNSRSTKIAMVVDGNGYFEMACPHLSQQQQGGRTSTSYQKVRARVSRGDVYVVPAGHPVVTVASNDENLQVVCFEINAQNNQRQPLAGNNNILKQLEREAKELSFNAPATQVEEMLNKQQESCFFPGPQQHA